jgi:hypothetical protein
MVSKKFKTIVACVLTLTLAFAVVGCGSEESSSVAKDSATEAAVETTEEAAAAAETEAEAASDTEDFSVASNLDAATIKAFASKVQDVVSKSDWNALADLATYPVCVNGSDVASKEDLLKLIDEKGVQDSFVNAVKSASVDELSANSQGIMIGDGEVWFIDNAAGDGLEIRTLNTFVNE